MEEMWHITTTWKQCWPKRRLNRFCLPMPLQNILATSLSFGLECLRWEFNSPQCSKDGGWTSIVALLDLRNPSGYSAALVVTPTPSTRNAIDQGRHTFLQSRTRWWSQSWGRQRFSIWLCKRRSQECRPLQRRTTMTTLRWSRSHLVKMKKKLKLKNQKMNLRRLRRVVLGWNRLQVRQTPGLMTSKLMMMQKTWGVNLPKRRNAEQRFEVSVISSRKLSQTHQMPDIV